MQMEEVPSLRSQPNKALLAQQSFSCFGADSRRTWHNKPGRTKSALEVQVGELFFQALPNAQVQGCSFTSNSAKNGGGIFLMEMPDLQLQDGSFTSNAAESDSGDLFANESSFTVDASNFTFGLKFMGTKVTLNHCVMGSMIQLTRTNATLSHCDVGEDVIARESSLVTLNHCVMNSMIQLTSTKATLSHCDVGKDVIARESGLVTLNHCVMGSMIQLTSTKATLSHCDVGKDVIARDSSLMMDSSNLTSGLELIGTEATLDRCQVSVDTSNRTRCVVLSSKSRNHAVQSAFSQCLSPESTTTYTCWLRIRSSIRHCCNMHGLLQQTCSAAVTPSVQPQRSSTH